MLGTTADWASEQHGFVKRVSETHNLLGMSYPGRKFQDGKGLGRPNRKNGKEAWLPVGWFGDKAVENEKETIQQVRRAVLEETEDLKTKGDGMGTTEWTG